MKAINMTALIIAGLLAVAAFGGCSLLSTVNERALTVDDVVEMACADVGSDVIRRQIEATRSRFELTAQDIIRLKKAGVEDSVLEAMIDTENMPDYFSWEFGYDPYEYGQRFGSHWYPVSYHYPYTYPMSYPYMYPYATYRRSDLLGRFYRYAPIVMPYHRDYSRSYDPYFDERMPEKPSDEDEK